MIVASSRRKPLRFALSILALAGLLLGLQCGPESIGSIHPTGSTALAPELQPPPTPAYGPDSLPMQRRHEAPANVELGTTLVRRTEANGPAGVAAGPPTAADLAETVDVRLDAVAGALATSLGNDLVAIFDHVRNELAFQPFYIGSVKGSEETLLQGGGNDVDLASALLAVLRSAGIPCRYVQGRVRMPVDDAMAWTGTTSPQAAGTVLATAGFQAVVNNLNMVPVSIDLDHTWVEAYVDNGLRPPFWLALDPSFKRHTVVAAIDPVQQSGAPSGLATLQSLLTHGDVDPSVPVVNRWDPQQIDDDLRAARRQMVDWFVTNQPTQSVEDWLGKAVRIDEPVTRPSKWLAFEVLGGAVDTPALTANDRHRIRLQTAGIDVTLDLPTLAGQRVTLSYVAASPTEQALIDGFGGVLQTPPLGAQLIPELRVAGGLVAQGQADGIGAFDGVQIDFFEPRGFSGTVFHNVTYGGMYALSLDTQRVSPTRLQDASDRLQLAAAAAVGEQVLDESVLGELLHVLGMTYFGHQDLAIDLQAGLADAIGFHQVNEALIGRHLRPRVFGAGLRMALDVMTIDAQRTQYSLVSRSNDPNLPVAEILFAIGSAGSSLEAYMFRAGIGWQAVSTTVILNQAIEEEIPIYAIDTSNQAAVLPLIQASPSSVASMSASIAQGLLVITPERELRVGDWQGTAWIALDPTTGTGGYLLSGGSAGGAQTVIPVNDPMQDQQQIRAEIQDQGLLVADNTIQPLMGMPRSTPLPQAVPPGSPLDRDLSGVRVHSGSRANDLSQGVGAGAFTIGTGAPFHENSAGSDDLVPHEAVHSLQQQYAQPAADLQANSADADQVLANLHQYDAVGTTSTTTLASIASTQSQGVRAGTPVDYLLVSNGAALLANLGQDPTDGSPANRAQIAAAVADAMAQLRGWTRLDTTPGVAPGEIDRVYQLPNGQIVVVQTDFVEGGHQIGEARLDTMVGGQPETELTDGWLLGQTPGNGALDRALASGSISAATASAIQQARNNGTLRRELFVVGNQHHGNTVSDGLTRHVELGATGANSISTTLVELPDGTVAN